MEPERLTKYKGWTIGIDVHGGVYYYEITDPTGDRFGCDNGFYGNVETIRHDCQNTIDHEIVKRAFDIQRIEIKNAITTEGPR